MTRTIVLFRSSARAGTALLFTLCVFLVAGCSSGEVAGNDVDDDGLNPSEIMALRKGHKGSGGLAKALFERKVEQLKQDGVAVKIVPSGKTTKRPR